MIIVFVATGVSNLQLWCQKLHLRWQVVLPSRSYSPGRATQHLDGTSAKDVLLTSPSLIPWTEHSFRAGTQMCLPWVGSSKSQVLCSMTNLWHKPKQGRWQWLGHQYQKHTPDVNQLTSVNTSLAEGMYTGSDWHVASLCRARCQSITKRTLSRAAGLHVQVAGSISHSSSTVEYRITQVSWFRLGQS